MKKQLRILSLILALLMSLALVACAPGVAPDGNTDSNVGSVASSDGGADSNVANTVTITVDVVGSDEKTTTFTIQTAEEFLRGALEQENLVEGDESEYGLYIKSVNGELADYNTNGAYWAVYEGDAMAMTGVDQIKITDGGHYKLVYTKG
ncbi:MAG: DUF4430 domain-containing protein [Clostridia bacterium]|nr:DUF4430 domain-containing protein [Clostridia bacterium]